MKFSFESSSGGYELAPQERHFFKERAETPLSPSEEKLFSVYKDKYINAQPDKKGIEYKTKDKELLESLKNRAEVGDHTERSILFDKIIFSNREWWGSSVEIHRASEFDDWINGIDLILEFFDEEGARLGLLGLDTTVLDGNEGTLGKKLDKIVDKIERKHLAKLDYAPSNDDDKDYVFERDIPQALLGISPDGLSRLSKDIARSIENIEKGNQLKGKKEIKNHPIQLIILEEIITQLKYQYHYIDERPLLYDKKTPLLKKLHNIINLLENTKAEKEIPHQGDGGSNIAYDSTWKDSVVRHLTDENLTKKICPRLFAA